MKIANNDVIRRDDVSNGWLVGWLCGGQDPAVIMLVTCGDFVLLGRQVRHRSPDTRHDATCRLGLPRALIRARWRLAVGAGPVGAWAVLPAGGIRGAGGDV